MYTLPHIYAKKSIYLNLFNIISGLETKYWVFDYPDSVSHQRWRHMAPKGIVTSLQQIDELWLVISSPCDIMIESWNFGCSVMSRNHYESRLAPFGAKSFIGSRKFEARIFLQISLHNAVINASVKFHAYILIK